MGTGLSVFPRLYGLPRPSGVWILSEACGQGRLLLRRQNPRRSRAPAAANRPPRPGPSAPFSASRPSAAARRPAGSFSSGGCPATRAAGRASRSGIPARSSPAEGSSERLTCAYALSCAEALRCPCPSDGKYCITFARPVPGKKVANSSPAIQGICGRGIAAQRRHIGRRSLYAVKENAQLRGRHHLFVPAWRRPSLPRRGTGMRLLKWRRKYGIMMARRACRPVRRIGSRRRGGAGDRGTDRRGDAG